MILGLNDNNVPTLLDSALDVMVEGVQGVWLDGALVVVLGAELERMFHGACGAHLVVLLNPLDAFYAS